MAMAPFFTIQGALTLLQLPSAQYLGFFTAALVRLLLRGGVYCFTASTVDMRWFGRVAGAADNLTSSAVFVACALGRLPYMHGYIAYPLHGADIF